MTKPKRNNATWAWMLWDWAEQPYPTIIQTFIFATYITSAAFVVGASSMTEVQLENARADLAGQLGLAGAVAGLIVAISAPVLGRRSDSAGRRKFWLLLNSAILIGLMLASYFIEPNPTFFLIGLALYAVGNIVQETAFINYYAMLKQVTNENNIARVSGIAWGLGYVGGIILLLGSLVLCYLPGHPIYPAEEQALNIRVIFLFAAAWMFIFTIPLVLFVPEIPKTEISKTKESIIQSYRGMFGTIKNLRAKNPDALRFLLASAVYRDGLAGVFTYGAILGTVAFGFSQTGVILFGVAANIVSGIGAFLGGILDDKLGTKRVIAGSLIGMLIAGVGVFALAGLGSITYWIFGLALCLFVGPAQASSRTFVARFAPTNREGEIFGLYQTTGRAASFLSPLLWWVFISIASALSLANPTIYGIIGIMVVLGAGLAWLLRVNPKPAVIE
ncbi:MAG: MFS transporter [Acidobacteria bacterium]|nr:MFS transporter [Acidobacteriota bacterium]NDC49115.1 MFS transporter [Micrococcales bacterium]